MSLPSVLLLLLFCSECLQLPAILHVNSWPDLPREVIINLAFTLCQALNLSMGFPEHSSKSRMALCCLSDEQVSNNPFQNKPEKQALLFPVLPIRRLRLREAK